MESYYKDSLSTAIANMLLQCGFENSSKRALDEFVGLSLSYMKNIVSKISSLTDDCNLVESDIVMGLGALKLHGYDLDEMFNFLQNYNDIFPPPPTTYFGPIPQKSIKRPHEDKPQEIVSWAPEMSTSLATIGMKLKNNQIVSDPSFDRSKFLALSIKSPNHNSDSQKPHHLLQSQSTKLVNSAVKYGSNCSYQLPPEAYPNKYEPPTIDLDTNGAVVGLNGKSGKLPDPYINDLEEQDILRQKSKFTENSNHLSGNRSAKLLPLSNQLFNGVRRKQRSTNLNELSCHNSPQQTKKRLVNDLSPATESQHQKYDHIERPATVTTSDDAWTAALQAKVVTTVVHSSKNYHDDNCDDHNVDNNEQHYNSPPSSFTPIARKQKKRHRSPSEGRTSRRSTIKKRRVIDKVKIEVQEREMNDFSQIYQNESTMDSRTSDAVPFSSPPDRELSRFNYFNNHNHSHQSKEKSTSNSPRNFNRLPDQHRPNASSQFSYTSEIVKTPLLLSTSKSKKKRSTRRTHFSNKRKKKPVVATRNYQHYFHHDQLNHTDHCDDISVDHNLMHSPSGHSPHHIISTITMGMTGTEDSDDDGTEPMKESSEEMLRLLDLPTGLINSHNNSPYHPILNNRHNHHSSTTTGANTQDNSSEGGGIKIKIKLSKTHSDTNHHSHHRHRHHHNVPSSPYITSSIDLSSPPPSRQSLQESEHHHYQQQHHHYHHRVNEEDDDSDRRSVSERLHLMQDDSPVSPFDGDDGGGGGGDRRQYEHSPFEQSPPEPVEVSNYRYSPESAISSPIVAQHIETPPPPPPAPIKIVMRPMDLLKHRHHHRHHHNRQSQSSHSSPKTLPALDDCDNRVPPSTLSFKTSAASTTTPITKTAVKTNSKKRKRSSLNSSTKKSKSKKSSKRKAEEDVPRGTTGGPEKMFISVDDIFSEEEEENHYERVLDLPLTPQSHVQAANPSPPCRLPIPTIKIRPHGHHKPKKAQPLVTTVPPTTETATLSSYSYSCLQGEAHYESEDGKVVYICPVCNTEDNGSLMLQCDLCQDWYHGLCLGIFDAPPEQLEWFCPRCREDRLSGRTNSGTRSKPTTAKPIATSASSLSLSLSIASKNNRTTKRK